MIGKNTKKIAPQLQEVIPNFQLKKNKKTLIKLFISVITNIAII